MIKVGIKTAKKQRIAFILTKYDEILKLNGEINLSDEIIAYINNGTVEKFNQFDINNLDEITHNSENIEAWLRSKNCNSFINLAKNHFKEVLFAFTSSVINPNPENRGNNNLSLQGAKCILEPLIWAMHASQNQNDI